LSCPEFMQKLLFFFLLIVLGWDVLWTLMGVNPLFPWQLQEKLEKAHPNLVLLDVRTPKEFHWFHLPGAQNEPLEKGLANSLKIPKNRTVVVICLTGHRSPLVAYRLKKESFMNLYNLTWGMAGWEVWQWIAAMVTRDHPEPERKKASEARQLKPGPSFDLVGEALRSTAAT
jgi:rhodanese-related sulfurtransferase